MKLRNGLIATLIVLMLGGYINAQESNVLDGIYIKEHTPGRKPIPYGSNGPYGTPLVREANVMWMKRVWRRIDLREKINHPLYFPIDPIADRRSLFDVLKDAILMEGTITAYDPGPLGDDDEFKVKMTLDDVKSLLFSADTVYTEDPETEEMIPELITTELKTDMIKQFEVKEEWFFDRERSVLDVRIIGLCPMKEVIDEVTGEFRGYQPLFWVYFPEARYVFANREVFNPKNDAERRTMEDIFWKRQFGSYVVKESNVYDRFINEYLVGLDALLEADRVKDDIFVLEHDLWHF